MENANPVVFQRSVERLLMASEEDEDVHDPIDDREIFDILFKFTKFSSGSLWFYNESIYAFCNRYSKLTSNDKYCTESYYCSILTICII